jgi:hypothetical protein
MLQQNKLECLSLTSISEQIKYIRVKLLNDGPVLIINIIMGLPGINNVVYFDRVAMTEKVFFSFFFIIGVLFK